MIFVLSFFERPLKADFTVTFLIFGLILYPLSRTAKALVRLWLHRNARASTSHAMAQSNIAIIVFMSSLQKNPILTNILGMENYSHKQD